MFSYLTCMCALLTSLLSLLILSALFTVYFSDSIMLLNFNMFSISKLEINLSIYMDFISATFSAGVLLISLSVMFFGVYYLKGMLNFGQFYITLSVFIFSMLILIFSPNMFSLMLGWDGLGVSSYLLVIYYKSTKSLNAGLLTGISNRVGDGLILVSLGGLSIYPSLSLPLLSASMLSPNNLVVLLILVAASTKSAQLPFSAWLPAAMAAPTPVSALVHSSTLVTAGIYLLLRLSCSLPVIYLWPFSILGATTMILASLSAMKETDGKKIVALSTLSQLGVMVTGFSFSLPSLVFFHLLTHAFFKALLFISTGYLIHNNNNYQDLRRMGGSMKSLSMNISITISSKVSLAGLPFFAAFYSKESLLESLSTSVSGLMVVYVLMLSGVILTILYSVRFVFLSSYLGARGENSGYTSLKSSYFTVGSMMLFLPSVMSGKFLFFILSQYSVLPEVSVASKSLVILLITSSLLYYHINSNWSVSVYKFYSHMWGLPLFAGSVPVKILNSMGLTLMKRLMFSVLDYMMFSWMKKGLAYSSVVALSTNISLKLTLTSFMLLLSSVWVLL